MNYLCWSMKDIAEHLRYKESVVRRIVAQPDFPAPVRVLDRAHPRWIAEDVVEYVKARRMAA